LTSRPIEESMKRKTEELIRLLQHYLMYLGQLTGFLKPTSEKSFAKECGFKWKKLEGFCLGCRSAWDSTFNKPAVNSNTHQWTSGFDFDADAWMKDLDSNPKATIVQSW
jgi:hypothetical protein